MINTTQLSKQFGDLKAVDKISLQIVDNSIFGLAGTNGAGKSTFLRMLAGVLKQDEGEIEIDGETVWENEKIKGESEFDNYIDYLENLKFDCEKRYSDDCFHSFDYVINLFQLELSNNENEYKMNLYKNAIKYAVEFEHNNIQNMSYEGFENNGLIFQPENMETTLLTELVSPNSWSDEVRKYSYELGKISYLNDGSDISNIQWAYIQLKHVKPFLEKYVSFEKANSDFEYYALVNLALYLECLENDCLINKNIPMDKNYRISI